ncbi:MAG: phospholipid carrier-dependent glycosyltransferase [Holophagales bacterium]|nr:phospholipid carrier-dependent glycosyltransferase [Holophagales bacterium]
MRSRPARPPRPAAPRDRRPRLPAGASPRLSGAAGAGRTPGCSRPLALLRRRRARAAPALRPRALPADRLRRDALPPPDGEELRRGRLASVPSVPQGARLPPPRRGAPGAAPSRGGRHRDPPRPAPGDTRHRPSRLLLGREKGSSDTGRTAVALFLSAPVVISLATSGYVEALLAMLVTAALFSFSRWDARHETAWLLATALFAGAASGVKYLGLYWLGLLGLAVLLRSRRGERVRHAALFGTAAFVALAPWYGRILFQTHNPLFPYLPSVFGSTEWDPVPGESLGLGRRLLDVARIPWDTLFARDRVNFAPPFSPWLALSIPLVLRHGAGSRRTAALAAAGVSWAFVWAWLPHDARYLTLLLPAASVVTAAALHDTRALRMAFRRPVLTALLILAPGPFYALYRIALLGPLPSGATSRNAFYERHLPEWKGISFLNGRAAADDVTFVWGCEQLRVHLRGKAIGDHTGPVRYDRVERTSSAAELAELLRAHRVRFLLVASRARPPQLDGEPGDALFRLLYRDGAVRVYELV